MVAERNRDPVPDRDGIALQTPVTTVIQQRPKPEAVGRYEDWLKEIIPVAQQFAGHRGVNVIRPHDGSDAYTIVLHFDAIDNLQRWLSSDIRKRLMEKVQPFMRADESIEIKTGFEFWFTPTAGAGLGMADYQSIRGRRDHRRAHDVGGDAVLRAPGFQVALQLTRA
jgi:quinol monooxygenase YgiN